MENSSFYFSIIFILSWLTIATILIFSKICDVSGIGRRISAINYINTLFSQERICNSLDLSSQRCQTDTGRALFNSSMLKQQHT